MVEMKLLDSREDWLSARFKRIGGSEASCIVGMNPWKSNVELWEEKTGKKEPHDLSESPFVKYGNDAEPHLRWMFTYDFPQYVVEYAPNNMWLNDKYPFAHASLDGWLTERETGRKGILEIKTTNILQSMQKEKWNDRIPDNYYCQVLWYLGVTEFDFAVLKAQLRYEYGDKVSFTTNHYKIEREEVQEDIDYLFAKAKDFYGYVTKDVKPPLLLPEI